MEFENLNKVQKMYAFSDQEMSNYLEIDRATLYRWKEAGEIPESYDLKVNALIAFKEGVRDSGFSLEGKVDYLEGLKENVILGKKIPAGTGMPRYNDVDIKVENELELEMDNELSRPIEEELHEELGSI